MGDADNPDSGLPTLADQVRALTAELARRDHAQRRLSAALAAAAAGTYEWDLRTGLVSPDAGLASLFGFGPDEGRRAEDYGERVHPDDRARLQAAIERSRRDRGSFDQELRVVMPDGTLRWLHATGSVGCDDTGAVVVISGAIVEVTAYKVLTLRAQLAVAEAERASSAKDEFLAMLGHELRNPISPIVTALDLMRMRGEPLAQRERDVIERQVRHLTRLVDDLLDVSRIARGKVELRRELLGVAGVVKQAIELATPVLEERRHHLIVELPADDPLTVHADAARLSQIIVNLVTNAARYTPPGGEVRLAATRRGDRVILRVKDTGAGISPELLPRIFELFVQGKRTAERAEGGLGLGLAIVRNLVRLHDGTVSAHSAGPGQGSEFTVELPAAIAPPTATVRTVAATPAPKRRVLVVDDNVDAAELLAHLLRSVGHEVMVANSGPQALAMTEDFHPQVAVLDIGLPVMDGYELASRLRQQRVNCRLIALTGYGQTTDRTRAREAGFDVHLVKPVQFPAIAREVSA